jgi:hypothetical protein
MSKQPSTGRRSSRGTDVFQKIALPGADRSFEATYWDLWFVVVLFNEFDGDWEQMIDHFRQKVRAGGGRYSAESMYNHLLHLRQRLAQAELSAEAILGKAGDGLLKKEKRRARRNILERSPTGGEMSEWMIHTPRAIRETRALRGYWPRFPVSPERYADPLARLYKTSGYYTENQSFTLERKLSGFVNKRLKRANLAEEVALHRAFLTVVLEKIEIVDDSSGVIGDLYDQVFGDYIALPRDELDMPATDFLQDLLELLIWEDYGFTDQKQPAFFAGLAPAEVDLAEIILRTQWHELDELDLVYQSEEALTMLGLLCVEQGLFEQFVDLAEAMGSRAWQRITRMAERAEKEGRLDLALAVYEAALGPGFHERFLHKKYEELKERLSGKTQSDKIAPHLP